jgi:hypothetical protein
MSPYALPHRDPSSPNTKRRTALVIAKLIVAIALGGCANGYVPSIGLPDLGLFNGTGKGANAGPEVTLARDPAALGTGTAAESTIRNALDLADQKRFTEARHLMAQVRAVQSPGTDGFQAATCAMALLALREGDMGAFRRIGRQLDADLGRPVLVDPAYVEVVALYRVIAGADLPVNAPQGIKRLGERLVARETSPTKKEEKS